LRAAWTAVEILSAFEDDIASFDLVPGGGGDFELSIDGELLYSKQETGEYPELSALKQIVVNAIDARVDAAAQT